MLQASKRARFCVELVPPLALSVARATLLPLNIIMLGLWKKRSQLQTHFAFLDQALSRRQLRVHQQGDYLLRDGTSIKILREWTPRIA